MQTMCRTVLAAFLAASFAVAFAQTPGQPLQMRSEPQVLARAAIGTLPGSASAAIWRDGRIVEAGLRQGPGVVEMPLPSEGPAPLYEIGSISKVFTGLLLAQAVERGDLKLEDTLGKLLQGSVQFASADAAAITLGQLITHTSCLPRQFGGVREGPAVVQQIREAQRAELWAALASQTMAKKAPCAASYSNYGVSVVGELLSQQYDKPWFELVQENILKPLALADTMQQLGSSEPRLVAGFDGAKPGQLWDMRAFSGAGGLRSSASDLVRFGRAILAGRNGPLGAAAERLVAPLANYSGGQIGYAIFIDGPPERRTYLHDGQTGAYRALLVLAPDTGEVVAALASNVQAPISALSQSLSIGRYPVTDSVVALPVDQLPPYAGVFRVFPDMALHVAVQNGALYVRSTGGVFRAYVPVGVDRFARPAGGAVVRFTRDAAGAVAGARLEQYGRAYAGQRIQEVPLSTQPVLPPGKAAEYTGRYLASRLLRPDVPFQVREVDGQLMVAGGVFRPQPVFPAPGDPDLFRYEVNGAEVRFERDAKGAVIALRLFERGELRAVRQPDSP